MLKRCRENALSYSFVHYNNLLHTELFKWCYDIFFLIQTPKRALHPGCVLYFSLLPIEVGENHCPGEVLNSAFDAILTHSVSHSWLH